MGYIYLNFWCVNKFLMPNNCAHGFLQSLKKVELAIANKVFVKNAFPIEPAFSSTLVKAFGASAENVDFLNEATVEIINSWVAQQTKDKIKNLVKPGMPKLKWLSTREIIIYQSYKLICFVFRFRKLGWEHSSGAG